MAQSTEQKLNMSLDDLVKKDRTRQKPLVQSDNGPGPQRHQGRGSGGPMSGWPFRGPQKQQPPPPRMNGGGGRHSHQGRMQHGQNHQQQQWQDVGGYPQQQQQQQGPYQQQQRGSVFSRLGGASNPGGQQYMQQPQQSPQQPHQQRWQQQQQPGGYPRQQQQQQQHQQQQPRVVQPAPIPVKPKLQCVEEEDGHASLYHQDYLIIQVSPSGDMILDSGDDHSAKRRAAFNIALSHFNIAIREAPMPPGAAPDAQPGWNVSEGHRLARFADGMKIPSRGPLTSNRAAVLLAAYGENSDNAAAAAAAAQEASRRAAIAAGLLPESDAAAGDAAEDSDAARVRRLKAQGRYMPY